MNYVIVVIGVSKVAPKKIHVYLIFIINISPDVIKHFILKPD